MAFAYAPVGEAIKSEDAAMALDSPAPMDEMVGAVAELERLVLQAGGIALRYGFFYGAGTHVQADGFYARLAHKRQMPSWRDGFPASLR